MMKMISIITLKMTYCMKKFGLERIKYINILYDKARLYGDILFEDASFIFIDDGIIEYVY